jgi:hypothetical protein
VPRCHTISQHILSQASTLRFTHSIQSPSTQRPLRRRRRVPAIPLQIPCDVAPTQLREHLRDLVDLRGVEAWCGACGDGSRAWRGRLAEVPAHGEKAHDEEDEDLRDVDGLFGHGGVGCGDGRGGAEVRRWCGSEWAMRSGCLRWRERGTGLCGEHFHLAKKMRERYQDRRRTVPLNHETIKRGRRRVRASSADEWVYHHQAAQTPFRPPLLFPRFRRPSDCRAHDRSGFRSLPNIHNVIIQFSRYPRIYFTHLTRRDAPQYTQA